MFKINYRITRPAYEDFLGQEGFFQIVCNKHSYGDFYSKELEGVMPTISVYDCFERYLRILHKLESSSCVYLSDVDSFNLWIKFKRINEDVLEISLVESDKLDNSGDIEFEILDFCYGEWYKETILYKQFKEEIIKCSIEYLNKLKEEGSEKNNILNLENKIKFFL